MEKQTVCLLDGARGIYIPKAFVENYNHKEWGVSDEDKEILASGPDHEHYDDVWEEVLQKAEFTDERGKWRLSQDGDLFAELKEEM